MKKRLPQNSVVDLFCGVGGLTLGLKQSGLNVIAGIDCVDDCRYAYSSNNDAEFICRDVSDLQAEELNAIYPENVYKILVGCAPCQPFSIYANRYKKRRDDVKWGLLYSFSRLIREVRPEIISMENVPGLESESVFSDFLEALRQLEYNVDYKIVFCPDYGVPQNRKRLVLLASMLGKLEFHQPTRLARRTVRDAIGDLEPLQSGESSSSDPLHRCSKLNEINLKRIQASVAGGTWRDWSRVLQLECHRKNTGRTYPSVYGRMEWDEPSPTITTQFFGLGNGRFGHPDQDRALSLREGALLQTFPKDYKFVEPGKTICFKKVGKMIGNAVPPALGKTIGESIVRHLKEFG